MSVPPKRTFRLDPPPARLPGAISPADGAAGPRAISAGLGRRLAAAADGHRDGREIFFQARFEADAEGNYGVTGPLTREEAAQAVVPEGYGIFGPFLTEPCTDDISRTPIRRVTLELENGDAVTFEGTRYDALFWSSSALEKFVVPYYAVVGGIERAQRLRDQLLNTDAFMIAHDPNTEETLISVKGEPGPQLLPGRG